MRWITDAGGLAVIAHPGRYRFTANEEYALFTEFKAHGGRGVEVVTGSHTPAEYVEYADTAREFGLAASRGSDFHSPDESHTDLGQLPSAAGQADAGVGTAGATASSERSAKRRASRQKITRDIDPNASWRHRPGAAGGRLFRDAGHHDQARPAPACRC